MFTCRRKEPPPSGHAFNKEWDIALKNHGRNHLLVVEGASGPAPERVRGVISRAQVERQLGMVIDVTEVANSFAEIVQMVA